MILTFEEKPNKKYEIQDEHVEEIFDYIKTQLADIFEQYKNNDRDSLIASSAIACIAESLKQKLSNDFGANRIIEILQAVEI